MRSTRLLSVFPALALVVAACGSGGSTADPGAATAAGATSVGTPTAAQSQPARAQSAGAGSGSCQASITGAVTASWQTTQDQSTLQMDYWLPSDARDMLGVASDGQGFLLNCDGTTASVHLSTTEGTTASDFPEGPGTYAIRQQGTGSGSTMPGQIDTLVNSHDKNIWAVSEPGTLVVTTLTTSRFAGTFAFKIVAVGNAGTTAAISGSFDLGCTMGPCT